MTADPVNASIIIAGALGALALIVWLVKAVIGHFVVAWGVKKASQKWGRGKKEDGRE